MVIVRKEKFNSEKSIQYISDKAEKTENKSGMEDLKLGAAIDIGTTSIAVGLFDQKRGFADLYHRNTEKEKMPVSPESE